MTLSACRLDHFLRFLSLATTLLDIWLSGFRFCLWVMSGFNCAWAIVGFNLYIPKRNCGRFPRYDEYESSLCLNWTNSEGTSLTMIIPSESGPKADSSVSKETLPIGIIVSSQSRLFVLVQPTTLQVLETDGNRWRSHVIIHLPQV
jgi:hypothetical protein